MARSGVARSGRVWKDRVEQSRLNPVLVFKQP
jgi:hypothetical protein